MTIYYLMIKTHKKTGLKYLCQTSKKDPFKYLGSGLDWIEHLSQHGSDIVTDILYQGEERKRMADLGRYYSRLLNVVNSMDDFGNKIYANRIPETGGGGSSGPNNVWCKRADGSSVAADKVARGGFHLSRREDGTSHATDAVANGTHNFLGGSIQRKVNKRMLDDGTHPTQQTWTCAHCGVSGMGESNYARYHGDNCSKITQKPHTLNRYKKLDRIVCPHCLKESASNNYKRYHGDNCKRFSIAK